MINGATPWWMVLIINTGEAFDERCNSSDQGKPMMNVATHQTSGGSWWMLLRLPSTESTAQSIIGHEPVGIQYSINKISVWKVHNNIPNLKSNCWVICWQMCGICLINSQAIMMAKILLKKACKRTSQRHLWIGWIINGLVQDCSNFIASTLELQQSYTRPSMLSCLYRNSHYRIVKCNQSFVPQSYV